MNLRVSPGVKGISVIIRVIHIPAQAVRSMLCQRFPEIIGIARLTALSRSDLGSIRGTLIGASFVSYVGRLVWDKCMYKFTNFSFWDANVNLSFKILCDSLAKSRKLSLFSAN